MEERICLIGFDETEAKELTGLLPGECVAFEMLPRLLLRDGVLRVQSPFSWEYLPVSRVVFHGIFENDTDFLAALCLWGGPCYPNPMGMMDCRLRLPGLAKAVRFSRFGGPPRGFVSAGVRVVADQPLVAKWGNWHCGHDKERIAGEWVSEFASLIEPFFEGEVVRVAIIGNQAWQIRQGGADWKKSVHGVGAAFMPLDQELHADTQAVQRGMGLDLIANDYIVTPTGKHLLEVNHIPSVTCFPELWTAYRDTVVEWSKAKDEG